MRLAHSSVDVMMRFHNRRPSCLFVLHFFLLTLSSAAFQQADVASTGVEQDNFQVSCNQANVKGRGELIDPAVKSECDLRSKSVTASVPSKTRLVQSSSTKTHSGHGTIHRNPAPPFATLLDSPTFANTSVKEEKIEKSSGNQHQNLRRKQLPEKVSASEEPSEEMKQHSYLAQQSSGPHIESTNSPTVVEHSSRDTAFPTLSARIRHILPGEENYIEGGSINAAERRQTVELPSSILAKRRLAEGSATAPVVNNLPDDETGKSEESLMEWWLKDASWSVVDKESSSGEKGPDDVDKTTHSEMDELVSPQHFKCKHGPCLSLNMRGYPPGFPFLPPMGYPPAPPQAPPPAPIVVPPPAPIIVSHPLVLPPPPMIIPVHPTIPHQYIYPPVPVGFSVQQRNWHNTPMLRYPPPGTAGLIAVDDSQPPSLTGSL